MSLSKLFLCPDSKKNEVVLLDKGTESLESTVENITPPQEREANYISPTTCPKLKQKQNQPLLQSEGMH